MEYDKFNNVLMNEISQILFNSYKKEINVSKLKEMFSHLKDELKKADEKVYNAFDEMIELSLNKIVLLSIKEGTKFTYGTLNELLLELFSDIKVMQNKGLVVPVERNLGALIYGPPPVREFHEFRAEENFGALIYGPPTIEEIEMPPRKK